MTSSFIDFKDYESICPSIHHPPAHPRAEWENETFSEKYQQPGLVGSLTGLRTYIVFFLLEKHIDLNFQNTALFIPEEEEIL